MSFFTHEGVEIAFRDEGEGTPIVLIHGFASSAEVNWVATGWSKVLTDAGYRVIMPDNRGHGQSTKLYDPDDYTPPRMAGDILALIEYLQIPRAILMGYSMGARIAAFAASAAPERVSALILGGIGLNLIEGMKHSTEIIAALKAPTLAETTNRTARQFRIFAEQTKSDLKALAACLEGSRQALPATDVAQISQPVLIALGSEDDIAGGGQELADSFPHGEFLTIPRRDHMRATGDPAFKAGALAFLDSITIQ